MALRHPLLPFVGEQQYTSRSRGAPGELKPDRLGVLREQPLAHTEHERVEHDPIGIDQIVGDGRLHEHAAAQDGDKALSLRFEPWTASMMSPSST